MTSVITKELRDIESAILETNNLLGGASGDGATADKQDVGNAILASIDTKTPALVSGSVPVYVTNQLDISTITSYLLDIKNSCADIDANTDAVESKLDDVVSAINANGAVNHADLLAVVAELQAVDANTDAQESILTNILNKLIASPATLAEQQAQTLLLGSVYQSTLPDLLDNQKLAHLVDKKGRQLKAVNNGRVSYVASMPVSGLTPATNALKDFWRIRGSNTKTVYVKRITVSAYAGGRSVNSLGIKKRSTANIGGITTNFSVIPVDTLSPASNAVVDLYTTTPTTEGTLVATVASSRFLIPKNDDQVIVEKEFDFTETGNVVLRGANESLTLQCGQTIIASALFFITVEWDEE